MIDEWARYHWMKSNKVSLFHKIENLCRVIARRASTPSGERLGIGSLHLNGKSPKSVKGVWPAVRLQNPLPT